MIHFNAKQISWSALNGIKIPNLIHAFESYREFLRPQKLVASADGDIEHSLLVDPYCKPNLSEGAISMVWQIRMNKLGIANNINSFNDYMITVENPSGINGFEEPKLEVYTGTIDPKVLRSGMFFSIPHMGYRYIGKHHGIDWRDCLRQDDKKVLHDNCSYVDYRTWGARFYPDPELGWNNKFCQFAFGHKTIHTHGPGGISFANTSTGCFVIAKAVVFKRDFRPMLRRVRTIGQGNYVPIAYIQDNIFLELISHAKSINGRNKKSFTKAWRAVYPKRVI
jgi:hypothetical protein